MQALSFLCISWAQKTPTLYSLRMSPLILFCLVTLPLSIFFSVVVVFFFHRQFTRGAEMRWPVTEFGPQHDYHAFVVGSDQSDERTTPQAKKVVGGKVCDVLTKSNGFNKCFHDLRPYNSSTHLEATQGKGVLGGGDGACHFCARSGVVVFWVLVFSPPCDCLTLTPFTTHHFLSQHHHNTNAIND